MRFVIWQQALLLAGFVVLLAAYVVGTYRVTAGSKSALAIVLRLSVIVGIGTCIWIGGGRLLFLAAKVGLPDSGIRYYVVGKTYDSTFGFPFTITFWEFLHSFVADRGVLTFLIAVTVPFTLLLLSGLVVAADMVLARGPLDCQRHNRAYLGLVFSTALIVLAVQLWPQPLRNPEMAMVPIPERALNVEYGRSADTGGWPTTSFALEDQYASQLLSYYRSALEADGWRLERGEVYAEHPVGPGTAVLSKNDNLLEVDVPGGPAGAYAKLTLRKTTPDELSELRKPTPASVPAPIPTQLPR